MIRTGLGAGEDLFALEVAAVGDDGAESADDLPELVFILRSCQILSNAGSYRRAANRHAVGKELLIPREPRFGLQRPQFTTETNSGRRSRGLGP